MSSVTLKADLQAALESRLVLMVTALVAVLALGYSAQRGQLQLYGDAVAHLHIARRIFDSTQPGFRQLGSVWLPLPHILLIPFVAKLEWWQSAIPAAVPSMLAYVLAALALHKLLRIWLPTLPAVCGTAFFAFNPGLIYLSSTAMTEPLFLCFMCWSALLIARYDLALEKGQQAKASRLLTVAGLVLVAAVYTRYDGWVYTALAWAIALFSTLRHKAVRNVRNPVWGWFVLFTVLLLAAPVVWLGYNARQFGDALDFMRGPYSAKAIEARTTPPGSFHYPGWHNMRIALLYFLKASELGVAPLWATNIALLVSLAGSVALAFKCGMRAAVLLLFWMLVPFYMYSVAYGSVPIFIPVWFPHSYYNTRYGLEMLPAFAAGVAGACWWLTEFIQRRTSEPATAARRAQIAGLAILALIGVNTLVLFRARPVIYAEAVANSRTRIPFEKAVAEQLRAIQPGATILMYTSTHVGALQQAGIALSRTVNETAWRDFDLGLQNPAKAANYVVAFDNDDVAKAVAAHPEGLEMLTQVCGMGQGCASLYRALP